MADYTCPVPGCGFTSVGHSTQALARKRGAEHKAEHESVSAGEPQPMREIAEFNDAEAKG